MPSDHWKWVPFTIKICNEWADHWDQFLNKQRHRFSLPGDDGEFENQKRIDDLGDKLLAKIMMVGSRGIVIPSDEEWHGLNKLERDDEI